MTTLTTVKTHGVDRSGSMTVSWKIKSWLRVVQGFHFPKMLNLLFLLLFSIAIKPSYSDLENEEFSNLDKIRSLVHDYGIGPNANDEEYNYCVSHLREKKQTKELFGPFYRFAIEFSDVKFPCSPCRYTHYPNVTWIKLTFENKDYRIESNEDYEILNDDTLVIRSVRKPDFGTFYCLVEGKVGFIWSLEVESFVELDVVKARDWEDSPVQIDGLKIGTKWESWSLCNKCDQVGKQHRIGFCFVESQPIPHETIPYEALEVYKEGLSCNLFLLLHPDAEPELIQELARSPLIMLSFCKISCEYFEIDPVDTFSRQHPKLHELYKEEGGPPQRGNRRTHIRDLIPQKPTTFEAIIISLLILLQLYIVIHVCKNRDKAK